LNLEEGPGSSVWIGTGIWLDGDPTIIFTDDQQAILFQNLYQIVLVMIGDDQVHSECRHCVWRHLGVTTSRDHRCAGVGAAKLAQDLPGFSGSHCRDGTGVENAEVSGLTGGDYTVATACQRPCHGLHLADVETATDAFDADFSH
jgi:hypothetical protein